jgi:hypothetical protein
MQQEANTWSREELDAVATCLREDLRSAGPRFSIEFTSVSQSAQAITSVMESTHERWPRWVEWECPDTGEAIARFGEVTRSP